MPNAFDARNPPFDRLTPDEIATLRARLDIGYYRPDEAIISAQTTPEALFVIIKGAVEERENGELIALLGPKDSFDSRALVQGTSPHAFIAREETLAYLIPKELTLQFIRDNAAFGAFFYSDLSRKLEAVAHAQEEAHSGSFMRTRIADLFMHPAEFIESTATIEQAGRRMNEAGSNALLVEPAGNEQQELGIITGMNLAKAVILHHMPITASIAPVAHYGVITVDEDDFVFTALLEMTKGNKRRIAVRRGDKITGILEDIDLLGFLAGNAQVVAGRIDRAKTLVDLTIAAREINDQIRVLRRQDVRVTVIAEIISDLNRRLFSKTFALLAPPDLRKRGCLIVMGSEGRGEQTIRTDQDNGLILSEPVDQSMLDGFRGEFTAALESFGFPPCPGNVMVQNPFWSKPLDDFIADFHRWAAVPDETSLMNVAIFYDAAPVSGRADLLTKAKSALVSSMQGESISLGRFAHAIEAFQTPIGLFNNLVSSRDDGALDLKKGGIFPIVHGVRSLALEHGLQETGTQERIIALAERNVLREDFSRNLRQAFQFLMTLRLDSQLEEQAGQSTLIKPSTLTSAERDLLRDAFRVVKQFREILRRHFKLDMF